MYADKQARIFGIAGDPGGAAALAPVVSKLQKDPAVDVYLYAYYKADKVFSQAGLDFDELDSRTAKSQAARMLLDSGIDLLLTGTSANQFNLEKVFICAAADVGIPSLSILDFWSNYSLRFSRGENDHRCLPDKIAVMDELAKEEMIQEGIQANRINVTGQPAFDGLKEFRKSFNEGDKWKVRRGFGLTQDGLLVVFISQPLSSLFSLDKLGYDETTIFGQLVNALGQISGEKGFPVKIVFFPHLRETDAWWLTSKTTNVELFLASREDFRKIALASDLVTGITSSKLVEAALLGCHTVSLQLDSEECFDMGRLGVDGVITDSEEVFSALSQNLLRESKGSFQLNPELDGKATERVADLVQEMLKAGPGRTGLEKS